MHLFHIKENDIRGGEAALGKEETRHIHKVLRMKKGDTLFLTDSRMIYEARITEIREDGLKAGLIRKREAATGIRTDLHLYVALVRFPCFERILDEATQLGVRKIIPLRTEYTQNIPVRPDRFSRWQKIMRQAARQCFNPAPPVLLPEIIPFPRAVPEKGFSLLLDPYAEKNLKEVLSLRRGGKEPLCLFVGPEAGFSPKELEQAEEKGMARARLPSFILRTETAVLSALSDIIFYYDKQQPDHH